jgi:hypothetical protein
MLNDYLGGLQYITDDNGGRNALGSGGAGELGGLFSKTRGSVFVALGDLNSDPDDDEDGQVGFVLILCLLFVAFCCSVFVTPCLLLRV